jgi:hypothetical protein
MEVARRDYQDGQPPAYVFTSSCCGKQTVLPAWVVQYAHARTEGRLLIQCGRYSTDPLRAAGAVPSRGCGRRYVVTINVRAKRP